MGRTMKNYILIELVEDAVRITMELADADAEQVDLLGAAIYNHVLPTLAAAWEFRVATTQAVRHNVN